LRLLSSGDYHNIVSPSPEVGDEGIVILRFFIPLALTTKAEKTYSSESIVNESEEI